MKVGIHQPNYVPWCGFFAKIVYCDQFIFLDDADISPGQSYVYRSLLRDVNKTFWISEPSMRHQNQKIYQVTFSNPDWAKSHLSRITQVYKKAPYFKEIFDLISPIYLNSGISLASFNMRLIKIICDYLNISTTVKVSSELLPDGTSD